eukprot:3752324-Amphidinium_carterae.1
MKGTCRYGAKCRFKHDKSAAPAMEVPGDDTEISAVAYATAAIDVKDEIGCVTSCVAQSRSGSSYVVDTGSGEDLIGEQELKHTDWVHTQTTSNGIRLATANGIVECSTILERN